MRRITITLTDEEYAALERQAEQDRRTPREMAAYLVTHSQKSPTIWPDWTYRPLVPAQQWWQTPIISRGTTGGCAACLSPTGAFNHTCNQWQTISATNGTVTN